MPWRYNRVDKDQAGVLSFVPDFSPDDFKKNVLALADITKYFQLPIILTTSFERGPNGPMVPEIKGMLSDAPYFPRRGQINAWDNADFVKAVKATDRKQYLLLVLLLMHDILHD